MNRRLFLQLPLLTPVVAAHARPPLANRQNPPKGFKVKPGEGRFHGPIQLKGVNANVLSVKFSGKDTNGALAIFEQTSLSPLHVHPAQDEVFHVLDGEYLFRVGDEKFTLKLGETIFLPRQVPHSWIQLSERGRMLVTLQPAGKLEEFFITMAALKTPPTPGEIAKIFAAHDMNVVGPPVSPD